MLCKSALQRVKYGMERSGMEAAKRVLRKMVQAKMNALSPAEIATQGGDAP
jgi:hypothetical protein